MKKQFLLALSSIVLLTGGTAYVHQNTLVTRTPAAAQNKDLGLIRTHTDGSTHMRASTGLAVPTIEKRRSDSNERIKSVETALTNKMVNDPRYTSVFEAEDLARVSACAVSQAASQVGIEQFKEDISTQGTPGYRIFFHCMISVHSARIAYNKAHGIESPNKTAGNIAKKVGSSNVTPTETAHNNDNSSCSETNSCNGPREGDADFVGPVRPGKGSGEQATGEETGDNGQISNPFSG